MLLCYDDYNKQDIAKEQFALLIYLQKWKKQTTIMLKTTPAKNKNKNNKTRYGGQEIPCNIIGQ
jgi:hypothetical protein